MFIVLLPANYISNVCEYFQVVAFHAMAWLLWGKDMVALVSSFTCLGVAISCIQVLPLHAVATPLN